MTIVNMTDLRRRFSGQTSFEDESNFFEHWKNDLAALRPAEMAFAGGVASDRLAWVFASAYQAALRVAFPAIRSTGWAALCSSEGSQGLPGVTLGDDGKASGYKTWVAASEVIDQIVIKLGRGREARYFHVPAVHPGIKVTTPRKASFLSELSQGVLELENVAFADSEDITERSAAHRFSLLESTFVYLGFLGYLCGHSVAAASPVAERMVQWLEEALALTDGIHNPAALAELDTQIQGLADEMPDVCAPPHWDTDQRLIRMYSKGIQMRVAQNTA